MAVIPEISLDEAKQIIETRPEGGFKNIADFRGQQALQGRKVAGVEVKSDYFKIASYANVGRSTVHLNTIVRRGGSKTDLPVRVLMRSRGNL